MNNILKTILFEFKKRKWRSLNKHNNTQMGSDFPFSKVTVGNYTYGRIIVRTYNNVQEHLKIGNFCSIGNSVFLLGGEHQYNRLSTFPFGKFIYGAYDMIPTKGEIIIEDDVWIGDHTTILSGVRICQGAIIAAGSVVVKDIPPYAIAGGNPCKIIKYRFDSETIKKMLSIDFSQINSEYIKKHRELFYKENPSIEELSILPTKERDDNQEI